MKVKLLVRTNFEKVFLEKDAVIDVTERLAQRWATNGIAEYTQETTTIKPAIKPTNRTAIEPTSIILLTANCLDYTKKCLDSLAIYTRNFQLIIVDNGSKPETISYFQNLKKFKDLTLVINSENKGVPYAWNEGIKLAKYDYIAILNNDILLTPHWLDYLQECFQDNPECSVASPTTSYSNGIQCDWRIAPKRFDWTQHDINDYAENLNHEYIETEVYGFAFLTHKKVIEKIGVFDNKRYGMGATEEVDFNWRSRQSGFKTYWVKHSYVHHYGHITYEKGNIGIDVYALTKKSRIKFADRVANEPNLFVENDVKLGKVIKVSTEFEKKTDVLMVTLDRKDETILTLASLFTENDEKNFNLTIVDNGSSDIEYLNKLENVKIIKNKNNIGLPKALNQGLAQAKSKYIVILHNDIVIKNKDWIAKAISYMEANEEVGIVGVAGWKELDKNGHYRTPDLVTAIEKYKQKPYGQFEEVAVTDGCANVIRNLGLAFDENYGLLHFQDLDICMQYRQLGYQIFVMNGSAEHLAENRSKSSITNKKYTELISKKDTDYYLERNRIFIKKWPMPAKREPIPIKMITWNRLEYTKRAINSILENTDYPFILWIWDNASGDGTIPYLKSLKDSRIEIHYSKTNLGLVPPFNIFLQRFYDCKYIAQVDNDCIMPPQWLTKLKAALDNFPLFVVSGDHYLGIPYQIKTNKEFYDHLETIKFEGDNLYLFSHGGMGNLVRRKWLDKPVEVQSGTLGGWVQYQCEKWHFENKTSAFHSGVWINLQDMLATNTPKLEYAEYRKITNTMRSGTGNRSGFATKPLRIDELEEIKKKVKEKWQTQN